MPGLFHRVRGAGERVVSTAIVLRETTRASRRWQTHAVRTLFSALLIATLLGSIHAAVQATSRGLIDIAMMGYVGRWIFTTFAATLMLLVAGIAPIAAAQAIHEEADQGTIDLLLLTELTPTQILLGKLFSRVFVLLTMVLGAMPILLLAVNMGGVSALEVVAVAVHACTTVVLMTLLGAFFALYTRSPLLAMLASVTYGVPFFALLPSAYALLLGDPGAAVHFSPLAITTATGAGAFALPLSYLPSTVIITGLLVPFFTLKCAGAPYAQAFENTTWKVNPWFIAILVWIFVAVVSSAVAPMAWLDSVTNASVLTRAVATVAEAWIWAVTAIGVGLSTWVYLRLAVEVVDSLDGLFGGSAKITPAEAIDIVHPIAWRETRSGQISLGPILATWGLIMLALLQTGWWLVPGGTLAIGVAHGVAMLLLTAWLGTRAFVEERRLHTLEALIATPLASHRILGGKLVAVLRPTLPLWLATGPFLVLGVPHLSMMDWLTDNTASNPWGLFDGLLAWLWLAPVWLTVALGAMAIGLRAPNPRSAFALAAGLGAIVLGTPAAMGTLLADTPWAAALASLCVPPSGPHTHLLHYLLSAMAWTALAVGAGAVLLRRLRPWALRSLWVLGVVFGLPERDAAAQSTAQDPEQVNQLRIDATQLADGHVRTGTWTAATVTLENLGAATTGRLELVDEDRNRQPLVWSREVELAAGTRKDVTLLFRAQAPVAQRTLTYTTPSGRLARVEITSQRSDDAALFVGIIGDDALGLPAALPHATGPVVERGASRPHAGEDPRTVRSTAIPPAELPAHAMALSGLDWLVWPDADPRGLSDDQTRAIVAWVADGGHLILNVSETARQVHDSPLDALIPGRIGPPRVDDIAPLLQRVGRPDAAPEPADLLDATTEPAVDPGPAPAPVARFRPRPDAVVMAETPSGQPIWVSAPFGYGTVHLLLTDLRLAPLADVDRATLWRHLLWMSDRDGPHALGGPLAMALDPDSPWGDVDAFHTHIRKELASIHGLAPIPMAWLVGAGLLYLLLIGPLDYRVLRALRRPGLTWVTFPLTVVVFTTGSVLALRSTKGSKAMLTRVEIIDVLPDASRWRGDDYFGVFSTRKVDLTVTGGFPDATVVPMDTKGFMDRPRIAAGFGPGQLSYAAETWTIAYGRSSWVVPTEEKLLVEYTPAGLTVTNHLGVDLAELAIYDGSQRREVHGALADGQRRVLHVGGNNARSPLLDRYEALEAAQEADRGVRPWTTPVLLAATDEGVEPLALDGLETSPRSLVVFRQALPDPSAVPLDPEPTP